MKKFARRPHIELALLLLVLALLLLELAMSLRDRVEQRQHRGGVAGYEASLELRAEIIERRRHGA